MLDRFLERNLFGLAYRHTETDFLSLINEKIGSLPISKWQSALAGHIAFTRDPEDVYKRQELTFLKHDTC